MAMAINIEIKKDHFSERKKKTNNSNQTLIRSHVNTHLTNKMEGTISKIKMQYRLILVSRSPLTG